MAKVSRIAGSLSNIEQVFIRDSSSTTGAGLAGLVYNSASLTAYYKRNSASGAEVAITLADMTIGTFTSGGFKEIGATNMPGWYQFCPPDAAYAAGAKSVGIHLKGASNMAPLPLEVDLDTQVNVKQSNGNAVPASGAIDANVVSVGPSGSGVAQTAGDVVNLVTNTGATSAALNQIATARTLNTGTETGSIANTYYNDASYWKLNPATNALDVEISFDVRATYPNGNGVSFFFRGYGEGVDNTYTFKVYDWVAAAYKTIHTLVGIAGVIDSDFQEALNNNNVGTGGNAGLVKIQVTASGLTSGALDVNQLLVGVANVPAFPANFANFAITSAGGVTLGADVTHGGGTTTRLVLANSTSSASFEITNSAGPLIALDNSAAATSEGIRILSGAECLVLVPGDVAPQWGSYPRAAAIYAQVTPNGSYGPIIEMQTNNAGPGISFSNNSLGPFLKVHAGGTAVEMDAGASVFNLAAGGAALPNADSSVFQLLTTGATHQPISLSGDEGGNIWDATNNRDVSVSPNWASVLNPTTTVDLSGTTISTSQQVDAAKIGASTTAAANLALLMANSRTGTVDSATFAPTTTTFETSFTTNADRFTHQAIMFTSGANAGLVVQVTGYAFTNSKVKLTTTAMASAPANGVSFIVFGKIGA